MENNFSMDQQKLGIGLLKKKEAYALDFSRSGGRRGKRKKLREV